MNKQLAALMALTSASAGLSEAPGMELLSTDTIGNGVCQAFAGWDFFDLKDLDSLQRDMTKLEPAKIEDGKLAFFYKICQVGWTLDPAELNLDAASMEGDCASADGSGAYLFKDGKCKYAFDPVSEFTGIAGATADWIHSQDD